MTDKTTFGYRSWINKFKPLLSIRTDGFEYENNFYQWSDIKKIKRYDSPFWSLFFYQAGTPLAYIFLMNGTKIKIRGRYLEESGKKAKVDFIVGRTEAYKELIKIFEEKTALMLPNVA